MLQKHYKLLLKCALAIPIIFLLDFCGILTHLNELDFERHFHYPLNESLTKKSLGVVPPPVYSYKFLRMPAFMQEEEPTRLTILVKSAIGHVKQRAAIRKTWGYESRFSDVQIRRVFLLGMPGSDEAKTKNDIAKEAKQYGDIVHGDFADTYFNNTIKTTMGIRWARENYDRSDFYLFVDDDYYVSIKNVLRFLGKEHETHHQPLLFAGYVFQTAPLRHKFSKWYVSLEEYPFDKWPPYVTAGAFIFSRDALIKMYETSRQMPLFRFDDIYLGILALKARIPVHHCDGFHFHRPAYYGPDSYSTVIASHGFSDPQEMEHIWNECRSANYA
ncbi:beta-1,3-galactosyltransferase brn [Drosophila tropicalis]|uniref:beta-1,3-galactosyltransferase brn n=1 Tax=Drosophila tropicalis TaxID=46794 RepID=UPI0035AC2985